LLIVEQLLEQYFLVPIDQDVRNIVQQQDQYLGHHKEEDEHLVEVKHEILNQMLVEKMLENFDNKNQHK
jgi:hypothetical protein